MINEAELKALDEVNTPHGKWWVPFVWTANLIKSTRKAGRISDDYLMKTIIDVSADAYFYSMTLTKYPIKGKGKFSYSTVSGSQDCSTFLYTLLP